MSDIRGGCLGHNISFAKNNMFSSSAVQAPQPRLSELGGLFTA